MGDEDGLAALDPETLRMMREVYVTYRQRRLKEVNQPTCFTFNEEDIEKGETLDYAYPTDTFGPSRTPSPPIILPEEFKQEIPTFPVIPLHPYLFSDSPCPYPIPPDNSPASYSPTPNSPVTAPDKFVKALNKPTHARCNSI